MSKKFSNILNGYSIYCQNLFFKFTQNFCFLVNFKIKAKLYLMDKKDAIKFINEVKIMLNETNQRI